jgi:hypothetical protein
VTLGDTEIICDDGHIINMSINNSVIIVITVNIESVNLLCQNKRRNNIYIKMECL